MAKRRELSFGEEIANTVTHGLGLLASLVALPVLLFTAAQRDDTLQIVGVIVFAVTLIALYAASTIYHALPRSRAKEVFHRLDHSAIYLLIAGTYTPFTLGALRGAWGWTLLALIWGLAAFGVLYKTVLGIRYRGLSTAMYVLMGWLVVIAIRPVMASISTEGILWILAGGLLYTSGVIFYVWDRLRYSHMIWHLFVLGGSVCHFYAVLWYAAPH